MQAFQLERVPPAYKIRSLFLKLHLHTLKNYIYSSKYPCLERMKSCLTWGTVHPILTFWRLFSGCSREDELPPQSRNDIFTLSHTLLHTHTALTFLKIEVHVIQILVEPVCIRKPAQALPAYLHCFLIMGQFALLHTLHCRLVL